jgi:hypothetical protein
METQELHHTIARLHIHSCQIRLTAGNAILTLNDALYALSRGEINEADDIIHTTITNLNRVLNPTN